MRNTPTDLKLLEYVYNEYYQKYLNYTEEKPTRAARIWVPLDLRLIADHFKIDLNILFGRFYYYLNEKYSYQKGDSPTVRLFQPEVSGTIIISKTDNETKSKRVKDIDCINFVYLASIVSMLQDENKKYQTTTIISFSSAAAAIVSLVISIIALAST